MTRAESLIPWSDESSQLLAYVRAPRALKRSTSYQESLVDGYAPNQTFWLPQALREKLTELGRVGGERPSRTCAQDILEHLLLDWPWESLRLEDNRSSRLETKALIEAGQDADGRTRQEAVMILNHKKAIEFLVDIAPFGDPWTRVIANIHALLMDGLLRNEDGLGTIRQRIVTIEGSAYTPWQTPRELERMYRKVSEVGQAIQDPLEAAFFLFTQIQYLQPFEDGNMRTARMACNLPLMKANFALLAFLDVAKADYFDALLGVYERAELSAARDLFEWAYARSVQSYRAVKESMHEPDPFRLRLRDALSAAIRSVVVECLSTAEAVTSLQLADADIVPFKAMLESELGKLSEVNYAMYRLRFSELKTWLALRTKS